MKKVNILGTEYTIQTDVVDDKYLQDLSGYTDFTTKQIKIADISVDTGYEWSDLEEYKKNVIRHEINHAFMYESGLDIHSDWGRNEQLIDWLAIQIPKIMKIYTEINAI